MAGAIGEETPLILFSPTNRPGGYLSPGDGRAVSPGRYGSMASTRFRWRTVKNMTGQGSIQSLVFTAEALLRKVTKQEEFKKPSEKIRKWSGLYTEEDPKLGELREHDRHRMEVVRYEGEFHEAMLGDADTERSVREVYFFHYPNLYRCPGGGRSIAIRTDELRRVNLKQHLERWDAGVGEENPSHEGLNVAIVSFDGRRFAEMERLGQKIFLL